MLSCGYTVIVYVVGGGVDIHDALKVVFQLFFEDNLPTQLLCVLMEGEDPVFWPA